MSAWMRTVCCTSSVLLATGGGILGVGCAGSYTMKAQITPLGAHIELTYTPLEQNSQFDFDGMPYVVVNLNGTTYWFYPSTGRVFNPATGQVYQLDDPSWKRVLDELRNQHQFDDLPQTHTSPKTIQQNVFGFFTPNILAGMGIQNEYVSMDISLSGNTPLPSLNPMKWPTLERNLFVFPDGTQGSPDPMRLELNGEPCDVLGYMAALGATDARVVVAGTQWRVVFQEDGWADVFIDNTFFTTIELH
jgi:hypothetical protein